LLAGGDKRKTETATITDTLFKEPENKKGGCVLRLPPLIEKITGGASEKGSRKNRERIKRLAARRALKEKTTEKKTSAMLLQFYETGEEGDLSSNNKQKPPKRG